MDDIYLNNDVTLEGMVASDFEISHEIYGEVFYKFLLKVPRLSNLSDFIKITISERLITDAYIKQNDFLKIRGQFRSYNNYSGEGNRLVLTVFAREVEKLPDDKISKSPNNIVLNGYICKVPSYRTTPFGREIADLLLAVNRKYGKSDYIPCIAWGRNAKYSSNFEVGTNIKVWGRIQSREYQKKIDENNFETKTAYEVSVSKLEILSEACV